MSVWRLGRQCKGHIRYNPTELTAPLHSPPFQSRRGPPRSAPDSPVYPLLLQSALMTAFCRLHHHRRRHPCLLVLKKNCHNLNSTTKNSGHLCGKIQFIHEACPNLPIGVLERGGDGRVTCRRLFLGLSTLIRACLQAKLTAVSWKWFKFTMVTWQSALPTSSVVPFSDSKYCSSLTNVIVIRGWHWWCSTAVE